MTNQIQRHDNLAEQITWPKRRFLAFAGAGLLLANFLPSSGRAAVKQPDKPDEEAFIERAFELQNLARKRGDQAYGAVVVLNGKIIGQSESRVIQDQDPTGHAEMAAIRDAARRLNNRDLENAMLYSSSRPCPMCEAGAYWAGINKMVHGREMVNAGTPQICRSS
jgi:tRNA(Arg) A34 adenosine deaminase TadA